MDSTPNVATLTGTLDVEMPIPSSSDTLEDLRALKNSLIGNPVNKMNLIAQDPSIVLQLLQCIRSPVGNPSIRERTRIEAAHVLSSLSYGPQPVIRKLLDDSAPDVVLVALVDLGPSTSPPSTTVHVSARMSPTEPSVFSIDTLYSLPLRSALVRAFKSVVSAAANIAGPREFGLGPLPHKGDTAAVARRVLEQIFQNTETLDVILPFLVDSSKQVRSFIAQMLGASLRTSAQRRSVANWMPIAERSQEAKGKRGWERTELSSSTSGAWAAKALLDLIKNGDIRSKEAALEALTALVKGNQSLALMLCTPPHEADRSTSPSHQTPYSIIMDLCKSRVQGVKLAACHCVATILRAPLPHTPPIPKIILEPPYTLTSILNDTISARDQSPAARIRACFILYLLVSDDKELQRTAFISGSLRKLASLVFEATSAMSDDWDEDELESISSLLEASLTAIASLTLHRDDNRVALLEDHPTILPIISRCLSHPQAGVRYGACQCVRALSRSVKVLRTNIGDSKLAEILFNIVKTDSDERVILVALMGIANMVNDFSPTRKSLIESGVISKLSEIIKKGDEEMKTNSIWALRNALYHSSREEMESIMNELGWDEFASLLQHPRPRIREIASAAVTNMMRLSEDVSFVIRSLPNLLDLLSDLVKPTVDEPTAVNALKAISNFSTAYRDRVLQRRSLLISIRDALLSTSPVVRKAAVVCVLNLVEHQTEHKEIKEAEIEAALKGLAQSRSPEGTPTAQLSLVSAASASVGGDSFGTRWENDKDTRETAMRALSCITKSPR